MAISTDLLPQQDSGEVCGIFANPPLGLASQSPVVPDEGSGAILIKEGEENMLDVACCRPYIPNSILSPAVKKL